MRRWEPDDDLMYFEGGEWKKQERGQIEMKVKQVESEVVVGSTKLPGSKTATFDGSNHEDAMTTRSAASSTDRLSSIGLLALVFLTVTAQVCSGAYYGKLIGKLSELHHGVSGEVYAADGRTLFIKDFTYDGEGPAAYFYAGNSKSPSGSGFKVRDERGTTNVLKRYRKKNITLTLPDGKTLSNIKWFSVWCDEFSVNFGDVKIPRGFDYPKPQKLGQLNGVHGVSSEPIVVVDTQTLLIPSFSYDGEAPDAKFWVGFGPSPSPQGIRVPDENGKEQPLRRYDRKTIVLTLPGDLTVHQLGHFGVWCEAFTVDFGHIQIPQGLNVPPSLNMLGVSPQSKLNCEVLEDSLAFEVRWAVAGDSIVVQLVGKLEDGQYMSFGLSANQDRSEMVGADVVVAWVDKHTLQGYAIDYILDAKSQCSGGRGSCPDTKVQDNTNSVRLLNAAMVNGYSIVTYQRPLKASDELDRPILTNGSQAIVWAIGPLNERLEVSFHTDYLKNDRLIEFGRPPAWNCPMPDQDQSKNYSDNDEKESNNQELTVTTRRPQRLPPTPAPAPKTDSWYIPPIECYEPEDGVLFAQLGPTGGKHGYPAITGHVGWGISWYINGLLIPEINVVRGKNYTFYVEGGMDPEVPARYHPFYITDDPVGGYQHKTPEEKAKVRIFAGVRRQRGVVKPTGVGRLCNWVPDQNEPPADEFNSFGAYQRTLSLHCEPGAPGIIEWTPDADTPDTVYYQCFTHRYLGWKINVHDSCDVSAVAASEKHEVYAELEGQGGKVDLDGSASIAVSSKVTPTAEFLQQHLHHTHREHGLRYPHSTTNPGKLSTSYMPLLTNANSNHYERLQSSLPSSYGKERYGMRPSKGSVTSAAHRHEVRVKEITHHAHLDGERLRQSHKQQRNQPQSNHHQSASIYRNETVGGIRIGSSYPGKEIDQEAQQSSNQQLSNMVPDSPRPLSLAVKYSYPPAGAQLLYSRVPHHYASNYHYTHHPLHHHHHLHQPEQRTQLMIIKRPVLMRRPIFQTSHSMPSPTLSLTPRPIFIERKKAIFRHPSSNYRVATEKHAHTNGNHQIAKLMKLETTKTRSKLEAKVSEALPGDIIENIPTILKPARNTGFDPASIVIEGGFKPIVRGIERSSDIAQKRIYEKHSQNDALIKENSPYRPHDNFEPVFIPSPPVTTTDPVKKLKKKTRNNKPRLDEIDDMEMAADRLESYYLPPVANTKLEELPPLSSGVLITFDGKRLKDSSLARSISDIEEHPRSGVSSAILSRTPQFGKFKGELPPPVPGEFRPDNIPEHEKRRLSKTLSSVTVPDNPLRKNTKLTLIERSKRSPHEHHTNTVHKNTSSIDFAAHNSQGISKLSSTGHRILGNIGYIIITVIFYYIL